VRQQRADREPHNCTRRTTLAAALAAACALAILHVPFATPAPMTAGDEATAVIIEPQFSQTATDFPCERAIGGDEEVRLTHDDILAALEAVRPTVSQTMLERYNAFAQQP